MSEHYPKGFLFLYTNGRVCVADGQGGQVPVNIPELIAERDALRAEIERLELFNVFGCDHDACSNADECDVVTKLIAKLRKEVQP